MYSDTGHISARFFLENLTENLVNIKQEIRTKKLTEGFLNPIKNEVHQKNSVSKIKNLQGVGKELYQNIDSDTYIKELRNEW